MLKVLIKKQFTEIFKGYFSDRKTGKPRSKAGIAGMFVLFFAVMAILGGTFGAMAFSLTGLLSTAFPWLYFVPTGAVTLVFGIFGSVFSTYTMLYKARDNDLLLSMPIPVRTILLSRVFAVYGMSFIYGGAVWVPAVLVYAFSGKANAAGIVFGILLTVIIAAFITVITCALGFVVALISEKVKSKSFITVFITVAFIAVYYVVYFNAQKLLSAITADPEKYAVGTKRFLNLLYNLGMAATGKVLPMIFFTVLTALLCVLCLYLLSATFIKLATSKKGDAKRKTKTVISGVSRSVSSALLRRELKRFTGSALYMLNCGLDALLMPIVAVVVFVKRDALQDALLTLASNPDFDGAYLNFLPLIGTAIILLLLSINNVTTPSIALEGKTFWLIRSLPVKTEDILYAKLRLNNVVNLPSAIISVIIIGCCFKSDVTTIAFSVLLTVIFTSFTGTVGLLFGLINPNFDWTNEQVVTKQDVKLIFVTLIGMGVTLAFVGCYWFFRNTLAPGDYIAFAFAVLAALTVYLRKRLMTKGVKTFENL